MARRKPIPRSQRKEFNRGTKLSRNSVGAKDDVKNIQVGIYDIDLAFKAFLEKDVKPKIEENVIVKDIKDLFSADKDCITFFHSKKYNKIAKKTKASYCITSQNLKDYLPKNCTPIVVENVLISTSLVTQKFYPNSIEDEYDKSAIDINNTLTFNLLTLKAIFPKYLVRNLKWLITNEKDHSSRWW